MLQAALSQYLNSLDQTKIPASEVIVKKDGKVIAHHVAGYRDAAKTQKATEDDLYFLYSSSKVMTVTAGLLLVEEGKLSLSDPVSRYLPAYGELFVKDGDTVRQAKSQMTVLHLFTMCGGCDYGIEGDEVLSAVAGGKRTTEAILTAYAKRSLSFDPGTHFSYSMCHDVLAGVIEKASGMRFSDFIRTRFQKPLGMTELYFHKEEGDALSRLSAEYQMNANGTLTDVSLKNVFIPTTEYESGGAGLITTARDYSRFLDMLAHGGVTEDGTRLLKAETVRLLTENRLTGDALSDYHRDFGDHGYGYGLGVRVHAFDTDIEPTHTDKGEFGWGGAAGSYSLVDTKNRISIMYMQHVLGMTGFEYYTHPHNVIRDTVYDLLHDGKL